MENVPFEVCESFSEEITPSSSEALVARMVEYRYRDIHRVVLDVSSPGGQVESAMSIYRALRSVPFELVTRNVGEVASMGNLVFLAGDRRFATPEATFLLHPIAFDGIVRRDASDLRRARTKLERTCGSPSAMIELDRGIVRLEREDQEVQSILKQRTKLTGPEASALVREGKPVSADYALAVGIVHGIIPAGTS
jgi:ATP-dependent protease ClpP protease subunit